jgi:uncharacterized protein involved in exopolysaccharide biosynthesis
MMDRLQRQLDSVNGAIQQTKDRRVLVETQLNNLQRMEEQFADFDTGQDFVEFEDTGGEDWESPELDQLREQLRNLKTRYSDRHPDVIRLQTVIAKLEKEQEASAPETTDEEEIIEGSDSGDYGLPGEDPFSAQSNDLSAQMKQTNTELASLLGEKNKIEAELEKYAHRIESTPKIEQMMVDLSRGYEEADDNYRSLLEKKFKAKLSENLEMAQQGEQFTIMDHAKLPDKPAKPATKLTLMLGFLMALAGGLGIASIVEYLDRSYFSAKETEDSLELPILVSVPRIMTSGDDRMVLVRRSVSAAALCAMVSILLYALYFLWKLDPMALALATG